MFEVFGFSFPVVTGGSSLHAGRPSRRLGIFLLILLLAPLTAGAQPRAEVSEPVTPDVLDVDMRALAGMTGVPVWQPGEPVRVMEDLEGAEEPGEVVPESLEGATRETFEAGIEPADVRDLPLQPEHREGDPVRVMEDLRLSGSESAGPEGTGAEGAGAAAAAGALAPAVIGVSFDGVPATGVLPPDTIGDVGPNHYVQMVNTAFAIYDKQGNLLAGPVPINSLWQSFGGPCETTNNGDPVVRYDQLADRWMLSQFALPAGNFHECIAISRTGDPVTGGWFLYAFPMTDATGAPIFPDYPKIGVWPDGYYMGTQRGFPNNGIDVWAFERGRMLAGQPAQRVHFFLGAPSLFLMPSDLDGPAPPAGAPNVFVRQVDGQVFGGADRLELFAFDVDWANPAASSFTPLATLPTAPFDSRLCGGGLIGTCVPQPGTTQRLETLTVWPMWRAQYRNFGSHETIVVNHTVDADGADLAGVRWYELRRRAGAWSIHQQATWAPDDVHRWMASVAMNGDGQIALGYSVSSRTVSPGLRAATREPGDPSGGLFDEITLIAGAGSQTHSSSRWGNYSSMDVDPADDCTFWYTSEYYDATSSAGWKTRVSSFTKPGCGDGNPGDGSRRQWAAKVVCGVQENPKEMRLARGFYATSINIHNPHLRDVTLTKKLALTYPPAGQRPGEIHRIAEDRLRADEALQTDCEDLRRRLFPRGLPASYFEGFVVIESRDSLDVTAVYTTATLGRDGLAAEHSSIDIERVEERVFDGGPDDPDDPDECPNLVVRDIGPPNVSCPGGAGTCVTRVEVTVANVGAAAAGSFQVLGRFDPGQSLQDTEVVGGLAAGASQTLQLTSPQDGNCFDPDCTICVTVDSREQVEECREDDNRTCETSLG